MLYAKMDLLIKKLEDRVSEKKEVMHIHDFRMTCEVCGDTGHSGNNCPKTQEDVNDINNNNVMPGFPKKTKHSLYVCLESPHIQQQNRNIKTMFI
jgi:hypothetical protein